MIRPDEYGMSWAMHLSRVVFPEPFEWDVGGLEDEIRVDGSLRMSWLVPAWLTHRSAREQRESRPASLQTRVRQKEFAYLVVAKKVFRFLETLG